MDVRQAGGGGVIHCLVSWGTRLRVLARGQSPCSVREPALVSATIESLEDRRLLSFTPPADPRVITNLDSDWKFLRADASNAQTVGFNDSSWSDVNVPHTWNDLDGQDGGNDYYRGIGWYRKHITPAASLSGKSMYLKFDGANITTDLWVNGNYLGQHKGGYSAFGWDVSQHLTVGADNVIAVRVNNAHDNNVAPLGGDYTQFGGIYRHVNLVATNKEHVALQEFVPADTSANPIGPTVSYWLHTPGVYLKPTNVTSSSANLAITTNLRNDAATARTLTVVSDIVDAEGNLVAELSGNQTIAAGANVNFVQNTTVSNPHLWNGLSDPYLYTVYVSVKEGSNLRDLVQHSLGFRSFSVNPNTGAMLNGSYYDLRGANFHQDRFNKGWAISEADQTEDVDLVQEMGSTFVRLAHYPHPQFTYDLLDQRGMAAWSEIPLNGTGNAGVTNTTPFLNNAKMQIQEMIRQNYNHPSVLVWGIYNELVDNADTQSVVTKLNALAKQEDPTRLTVCATDKAESSAINWITDITAFNKYFGWYGGSYDDMSWWPDAVHANYPTRAVGIGEYGAGAALTQHEDNPPPPAPFGQWHPEEYQNLFHEAYWKQLKTRPFIWSKLIWNMFDFAADGRDEGDTPGRNDKGMVTFDRQTRKDAFYFYKANWSDSPVLYISSRRYTNRPNNTVPAVKIYANMESVTLKVNGVTVSTIDSSSAPDQIFQWNDVTLQGGANTIEVTGTLGGQTYTDTVTWNAPGGGGAAWPTIPELTGTPFARINFQPDTTPGYVGYEQDYGYVFGSRPNGQSYGWDGDNTGGVRERTSGFLASPLDERYTRLNHMQLYGIYTWELAVPNGTYDVHLVAGDVSFIDSHYALNIEGRLALEGTPTANWPWIGSVVRVDVTDGRLTITNNAAGSNNKIAYIELNATAGTQPDVTPPTATYGGEQFIPGQAVFDFNVIYEDAGNIDASSLNGQDIRVTGPNGFDQVAEFQFIDSPDNGATRTVRYRISAPDGRWTIEDSGSYTFWQEPNQVRDVSGNYRPPDIIATLNPTFPFAYGFSNRFYVDFGDLPISLGMNGEGELTAISSSGTHSLSPALFDDILVTGTNAGNALTLLTTMPRPMTFIGNGGNDAMTVGAIASHTFDADISSTLPNLSLTVSGSVSFSSTQRLGALVIDGGSAVMSAGGNHTLITDTLSISGGTLDLADNDLVVNGGSFETIRDLVFQGFGNPAGPGITSSTSDGRQILALFDNSFTGASHWNGHAISPGAIVGMYTFMGDMNLDGIVTGDDYTVIDANLDTTPLPGSEWIRGDANLDGIITGDDYTVIDANLGAA